MSEQDCDIADAMSKYGGSFVKGLGDLMYRADPLNLEKIKKTWPEYMAEYAAMAQQPHENH